MRCIYYYSIIPVKKLSTYDTKMITSEKRANTVYLRRLPGFFLKKVPTKQ